LAGFVIVKFRDAVHGGSPYVPYQFLSMMAEPPKGNNYDV